MLNDCYWIFKKVYLGIVLKMTNIFYIYFCSHLYIIVGMNRDDIDTSNYVIAITAPKPKHAAIAIKPIPDEWIKKKVLVSLGPSALPSSIIDCTITKGTTKLGPGCGNHLEF